MKIREEPLCFDCEGERLFGILARPEQPADLGVVIVVGGPQTRVGSHRQFVLLARTLAAAGFPTLRFDVRGMGDSTGAPRDFEQIQPDIAAAIATLQGACPGVARVVLWGLCDAASAALLYVDATHDPRIAGLCLLNPWVRSAATLAKTQVKHYYGQRLLQREFWTKLFSGRIDILSALGELLRKLVQARSRPTVALCFQERMARGWRHFPGRILLILSGNDYTAKEFLEYAASDANWHGLLEHAGVTRIDLPEADHTFSSREWRDAVAKACVTWLGAISARPPAA
ncbi:MAG: hydrolase 1, exosortase A system-associated [Rhodocyclaceae bacterium]|uniref:hydrolase 1, exosortase A system-associated n=1 Tax=Sulfuricystis thermophila TaxID=2496847 RepID=UPI001036A053|nr:hydrolase 1, exosortase A system-associated [Sulfuricystis thermophila]MDI6749186.1 hydrolase 1, exosortase A system-associated [Rhodocyclaceae bacterium]